MAEKDIIVPSIKVEKKGIFDIKELYYIVKKWASDNGYDVLEKSYINRGDSTEVKLEITRKVDDYTQYEIDITISASNIKIAKTKKKDMYEGSLEVEFESILVRDYEGTWEKKPGYRIMRGFFDRFVMKGKIDNYIKELKEETFLFMENVRKFLNV